MTDRGLALIGASVVLVLALLGVQLASGGATFGPERPADPCEPREAPMPTDLDSLAEAVVLTGIDETACSLGVTRERLLLALPRRDSRARLAKDLGTDQAGLARAVQQGLVSGVTRLDRAGRIPDTQVLLPSVAERLGLPAAAAALVPTELLSALPSPAQLLGFAVGGVDVNRVFDRLDAGEPLDDILTDQIGSAVLAQARSRLQGLLPSQLQGLLGGGLGASPTPTPPAPAVPLPAPTTP